MSIVQVFPDPWWPFDDTLQSSSFTTVDAAGESVGAIGYAQLEAGSGSKTISAAGGGAIWWWCGTVTAWADAGSEFRVGLQGVGATGLEDGSWGVYGSVIGTTSITSSSWQKMVMTSGSVTLNQNDLFAIVGELVSRGGSDSINPRRLQPAINPGSGVVGLGVPYGTVDTGTLTKATSAFMAIILFDDGTTGWIQGLPLGGLGSSFATLSWNSGSSPNEYGMAFQPTVPVRISRLLSLLHNLNTTDLVDLVLYSDPLGSPSVIEAVTLDMNRMSGSGGAVLHIGGLSTDRTLSPSTVYGVVAKPNNTGNISLNYIDFGSGNSAIKRASRFGASCKMISRSGGSGAFAEVQPHYLPMFGITVNGLHDGLGMADRVIAIPPF